MRTTWTHGCEPWFEFNATERALLIVALRKLLDDPSYKTEPTLLKMTNSIYQIDSAMIALVALERTNQ